MLDNVVEEFVDGLTSEREFDTPLRVLLRAEGFTDIHYLHGGFEFGRDFVAKRRGEQYALQLKKGDVGQSDWRQIRGQLEDIMLGDISDPSFDSQRPRVSVLVVTGRLVGGAAASAQEYKRKVSSRKLGRFEVWDRENLVPLLKRHLAVSTAARWEVLGSLVERAQAGDLSIDGMEEFSRRWLDVDRWQAMLEYCLAREFLTRRGLRLHAFALLLGLLRALESYVTDDRLELDGLFCSELAGYADPILHWFSQVRPEMRKYAVVDIDIMEMVACGARLLRLLEIVSLDLLANPSPRAEKARPFFEYALALGATQKPVSDRYAASLIAVTLGALRAGVEVTDWLRGVVRWLGDAHETGAGLAGPDSDSREELMRVLAPPDLKLLEPRHDSLLAAAVLECLALADEPTLLADAIHDFQAVGIRPWRLHPESAPDDLFRDRDGCTLRYENLDALAEGRRVHSEETPRRFGGGQSWKGVAFMLLLRDRWWRHSLREMLKPSTAGPSPTAVPHSRRKAKGSRRPAKRTSTPPE